MVTNKIMALDLNYVANSVYYTNNQSQNKGHER